MLVKLAAIVAITTQTVVSGKYNDYVPKNKEEAAYPRYHQEEPKKNEEPQSVGLFPLREMSHEEMMKNRQTKHYEDFVNGIFVNTVEYIARNFPIVGQSTQYTRRDEDEDEFKFPPWDQNMLRWEVR